MSVISEFAVPVEDFPLGRALDAAPEMGVELERVVPTGDGVLPFFWVWGGEVDAFVEAVGDNPGIDRIEVLGRVDGGALVQAVWTDEPGLLAGVLESGATLLEVRRQGESWLFRLRSPDHEAVVDLQRYCTANDTAATRWS